jgi:hypothetical protein
LGTIFNFRENKKDWKSRALARQLIEQELPVEVLITIDAEVTVTITATATRR